MDAELPVIFHWKIAFGEMMRNVCYFVLCEGPPTPWFKGPIFSNANVITCQIKVSSVN